MSARCLRHLVVSTCLLAATVGASKVAASTFTVTSTADSGPGTLRQAILNANANLGADTIEFNIAGAGPHTIAPDTALPALSGIVVIDGLTQGGASCAGTWPPTLQIILNGANAPGSANGLFTTGNATIRGLVINGWGMDGVHIEGDATVVQSCFIGTNAAGTAAVPNGREGVCIVAGADSCTIGVESVAGATACQGNLISGNGRAGIMLASSGHRVAGNYIGTDVTGLVDLGNANDGVNLTDATCCRIGTNGDAVVDALERNVISGNDDAGIRLNGAQGSIIAGNFIGVGANGTTAVPNGTAPNDFGIDIQPSSRNNRIGTDACNPNPVEANIIANHPGDGIGMNGTGSVTLRNSILGNSIYNNAGLGICLTPSAGPNPNDAMDVDTGANHRQNHPVLTSANGSTITGTLNSVPLTQFRIEFFANTTADPSGFGEGEVFLTAVNVSTDAAGNAAFSVPYIPVAGKPFITSTATSLGASTALPCTPSHANPCALQTTNPVPPLELYNTSEFSGALGELPGCELSCVDIRVNSEPGVCAADVEFDEIATVECLDLGFVLTCTIDDGMGGTVPVSSGSSFPVGTTLVTCTLFAPTGAPADQCTFNVTVVDAEEPSITCPADIVQATDTGGCTAEVSFSVAVSDNCDTDPLPTVVCTIPDGMGATVITSPHVFPIGTTIVTCTATDSAGNSESCTFNVTVRDGQAPTINCPANITADRNGEECGAIVTYIASASDPCGLASFVCVPPSGSLFPVGTTTVTCTAFDLAGLSATCTFTVTVVDENAVVEIVCPDNIVTGTDDGECGATIAFEPEIMAPCSANRGLYVVTCRIDGVLVTSPHLFPVGTTTVECCVLLPAVAGGDGGAPGVLDCCEFTVTVTDDEDPVLVCRQNNEIEAGECGTVVLSGQDLIETFTDNCPLDCCDPKLLGPGGDTCHIEFSPSVLECPLLDTPIQVAVTATDCHGNTATCIATVIVRGQDCNRNAINDLCDICNGTSLDCDQNGVPDECECFWCNVREDFASAAPQPDVNAQLSHLGGGTPCGEKVADDFYLEPGCMHRISAVRGKLLTNSIPQLRRARVEFYEDCDGKPVDQPFFVADYTQDRPIPSRVIDVAPAADGFAVVTYLFDLCDECIWLEGGKTYWVSLIGLSDHIDHVDLSYWVAGSEFAPILGSVPVKRSGTPGAAWGSCNFGPWQSIEDCCIGCVNMDFCIDGYSCPIIWDNGRVDLASRGGSASGAHQQYHDRTADSFVIKTCRDEDICLIEAWIWTNCDPVTAFVELYNDLPCGPPQLENTPFRSYTGAQVATKRYPQTWSVGGRVYTLWRLQVKDPQLVLTGGTNYWVSAGALSTGNFNTNSFFAWSVDGCDSCSGVNTFRITPGQHRTLRPPPTEWADVNPKRDFAFRIAAKAPAIIFPEPDPGISGTPACAADANHDGDVAVDDIFAFLSAWFAGCP